jgi:hypothetical protein
MGKMKKETGSKAYYFLKTGAISSTFSVERTLPDMALYFDNMNYRKGAK